ncbi:MAG: zinc dependent phospholipase C family protein [Candidatus Enteromonas sp.]
MPAAIAHRIFADLYLSPCPYPDLARIGSEGPDPFMAYGMIPFRKRNDMGEVMPWGGLMHNTHLSLAYGKMIAYAASLEGEEKKKCFSYLYGLLSHFALDRAVHPYVFYRSGFDENGKYGGIYVFYHGYFESLMDRALAEKHHYPVSSFKALPKLSKEDGILLSKLWMAGSSMPLKDDSFYESYLDFRLIMRILASRHGVKRKLIRKIMGKTSKPYSLMMPPSLKPYESLDVLNEKKMTWRDPTTEERFDDSLEERYKKASLDLPMIEDILQKGEQGEDVASLLDELERNNDHDGGIYGQKKHVCDICLTSLPFEL